MISDTDPQVSDAPEVEAPRPAPPSGASPTVVLLDFPTWIFHEDADEVTP